LSLLIATPIGTQAFWGWMMVGMILLGLEMMMGTQWLLWSAASAAAVALVTLTGLPIGIVSQIVLFAALSLTSALMSRKLMKPVNAGEDVNDQHTRMVGQNARVLSGFEGGKGERLGRVSFDGVEWPAILETGPEGEIKPDTAVEILKVREGKLYIKAA
jgi:inner membrane protein